MAMFDMSNIAATHDIDDIAVVETVMRYHERTKHRFNRYAGKVSITSSIGRISRVRSRHLRRRAAGSPAAARCTRGAALATLR